MFYKQQTRVASKIFEKVVQWEGVLGKKREETKELLKQNKKQKAKVEELIS